MEAKTKLQVLSSLKDCVDTLIKIAQNEEQLPQVVELQGQERYVDLKELKKLAGIN